MGASRHNLTERILRFGVYNVGLDFRLGVTYTLLHKRIYIGHSGLYGRECNYFN